jgi:hypothetical protein
MGTISFKIYPNLKLAHLQGLGDISHDMLITEIQQLHTHPDWSFSFNTFIDFGKAVVKAKTESIARYKNFFETLQATAPVRKWAIHTHQDSSEKAFDMSWLPNQRSIIVDIFQTRNEALKFLNILPHQLVEPTGAE